MDYTKLRAELLTDPLAWDYDASYGGSFPSTTDVLAGDATVAAMLNDVGRGRTVSRTNVSRSEIIRNIRNADYPTTSAGDQIKWQKLNFLLLTDTVDASAQNIKDTFTAIFTGTPTLTALNTLSSTAVSRATELNLGGPVTDLDVSRARSGVW